LDLANRIKNVLCLFFFNFKFKKYVIKLRSKTNTYKAKRKEIDELGAEFLTQKRTEEILKQKYNSVKDHLVSIYNIHIIVWHY
jgi:hypothetical protein